MDSETLITLAFLGFYLLVQFLRKKSKAPVPSATTTDDQDSLSDALSEIKQMLAGNDERTLAPKSPLPDESSATQHDTVRPVEAHRRIEGTRKKKPIFDDAKRFEHRVRPFHSKTSGRVKFKRPHPGDPFAEEASFEELKADGDRFASHPETDVLDELEASVPVESKRLLTARLRNNATLKETILLNEILSPPVSRRRHRI